MGAPTGRTILHVVAVLLGVLAFQVHRQPQASAAAKPHQKIQRVQAGPPAPQRHRQGGEEREHLSRGIRAGRQPPRFAQVGGKQAQQEVGQVQQHQLFHIHLLHRSSSFRRLRSTTVFLSSSLNWASFSSTGGRSLRSAFLTLFLGVFRKSSGQRVGVPALEEDQVLGRRSAAVLFHRIVHAVLAGDTLKVPDGRVVDLNVGNALVLPDELLYRLFALGG